MLFGFLAQSGRRQIVATATSASPGSLLSVRRRIWVKHPLGVASGGYGRLGQDSTSKMPARKRTSPPSRTQGSDAALDQPVGSALRSVYQRTVEEQVPDDLLDLLGKLN